MDIIEKLKPFAPKVYIGFEVRDRRGRVIYKRRERGHSWVRNYYVVLVCQAGWVDMRQELNTRIRDTGGSWGEYDNQFTYVKQDSWLEGGEGDTTKGIVIGTGNTPPSIDDYNLEAKIPHGTGAGKMEYQAQADTVSETTATGWRTTLVRQFYNKSGASIYVAETGIIGELALAAVTWKCLLCRNVHDPAVEVPDTGILTVTYTIETTQPW